MTTFRDTFEASGLYSIDAFAAYRPDFAEIAKATIAAVLVPLESQRVLSDRHKGDGNWYQLLWSKLHAGAASLDDLRSNRLTIVTFNYDRSLEQYLLNAAGATFGVSASSAARILEYVPVIHVYGSLGDFVDPLGFEYYDGNGVPDRLTQRITDASKCIHTMPNERPERNEAAAAALSNATRLFALGFGFDERNCARVGLETAFADAGRHEIAAATVLGMTGSERDRARMNSRLPSPAGWLQHECDCLSLLRILDTSLV